MMKYFQEADIAVTVCDREGRIIDMNDQSRKINLKPGQELIGSNVLDCHPEPARTMLEGMMRNESKHVYNHNSQNVNQHDTINVSKHSKVYLMGAFFMFFEKVHLKVHLIFTLLFQRS